MEFRKRFRRKKLALFKSGKWHFHQDNTLVYNSILVIDYLTKMGIKTEKKKKNKRTSWIVDFAVLADHRVKLMGGK